MEYIQPTIINVIEDLPSEFSTHQFILELAKTHQHDYIRELYENLESEKPFQKLHAKLGKHLKSLDGTVISFIRPDKVDKDIFGNLSGNALWAKRS